MKNLILVLSFVLLVFGVAYAGPFFFTGGGGGSNAETLHSLALEIPDAADDGKFIQYEHTGTLYQMATPAGGGDMLIAVWDGDTDGFIDADAGGLDIDTSAATGVPSVAAGTWSTSVTLTHELGGVEADVSAYSGLLGITGGATTEVNTAAELETFAGLGAIANEILDDASAAAVLVTLGVTSTAAELNILDGVTSTAAELNILDGVTSTAAELNILDGVTSTAAELNLLDAVTTTPTQFNYINIADGVTGTGSVVLDDTPTLITPVLGAATGTSLETSGGITDTGGDISAGVDITTMGTINAYGDNSTGGGHIRLHNAAGEDGTDQDYWQIEADGTDLNIGVDTNTTVFVFNSDGSINKSKTPKITLDDTDGADGYIDVNAPGDSADDAIMTLGVDDSSGDDVPYVELDGVDEVVKLAYMAGLPRRIVDVDTSAATGADYTVTASLGSDTADWNGVVLWVDTDATPFDVIIPDCPSTATKWNLQITICQGNASETVEIVSASAGDNFMKRDGNVCTDGQELQSPAGAMKGMCATFACAPASEQWVVFQEQGGTEAVSDLWTTCTAAD